MFIFSPKTFVISFSFLSMCHHPMLTFFSVCPFSALISIFFLEFYFLPAPHPIFFIFFLAFETFPPTYPPHHLFMYVLGFWPSYLPHPTYTVTPIYLIPPSIVPRGQQRWRKNKMKPLCKSLHGVWFCLLKQINKNAIKIFDTLYKDIASFA